MLVQKYFVARYNFTNTKLKWNINSETYHHSVPYQFAEYNNYELNAMIIKKLSIYIIY